MHYLLLAFAVILLVIQTHELKEKIDGIDSYHISRVNQANRRIEELEDKLSSLEREVNWK